MAHTHAAQKALRKSKHNREYNLFWKSKFKDLVKQARRALSEKKIDAARNLMNQATQAIDKAAQKKIIKKNTAARLKSRLMQQLSRTINKK